MLFLIACSLGGLLGLSGCLSILNTPMSVSTLQAHEGEFDGREVRVIGSYVSRFEYSIVLDSRHGCSGFVLNLTALEGDEVRHFDALINQVRDSDVEVVEATFEGVYYPAMVGVRPPRLDVTGISDAHIVRLPAPDWLRRTQACPTEVLSD
jgi:hypothetical protein